MAGQGRTPRFQWTDQARTDLLLAMIRYATPSPGQWTHIIEETSKKGYTFNANAAQQHLMKLRKKEDQATAKALERIIGSQAMAAQQQLTTSRGRAVPRPGSAAAAGLARSSGSSKRSRGSYGSKRGSGGGASGKATTQHAVDVDNDSDDPASDVGNHGDDDNDDSEPAAAPPPAKKARRTQKKRDAAGAKAKADKKDGKTAVSAAMRGGEIPREMAPHPDYVPYDGGRDRTAMGYERMRTMAPPPDWVPPQASGSRARADGRATADRSTVLGYERERTMAPPPDYVPPNMVDSDSSDDGRDRARPTTEAHSPLGDRTAMGYERMRTMAPPPDWVSEPVAGRAGTEATASDNYGMGYERMRTMAPPPEYSDMLQAQREAEAEAQAQAQAQAPRDQAQGNAGQEEEKPWYMV